MLALYMQIVGLVASIIVALYVCPRMISIPSDMAVLFGIILLIIMIPFIIWQFVMLFKHIFKHVKEMENKPDA